MDTAQPIEQITKLGLPVRNGARVPLCGPGTWQGADFGQDTSRTCQLSRHEVDEIDHALNAMNREAIGPGQLGPSMFPLPELGRRLIALRKEVVEGRGFVLIKGFPAERYDRRDAAAVFLGCWTVFRHSGVTKCGRPFTRACDRFGIPVKRSTASRLSNARMYPARDLRMAQLLEDVPTLSAEQEEALTSLQSVQICSRTHLASRRFVLRRTLLAASERRQEQRFGCLPHSPLAS